ncbi:MAG: hypothetical protein ACKO04_10425 [Actinomycetes bacterium]
MRHISTRVSRTSRILALGLVVAMVGGVTAACAAPAPSGGTNTQAQFCDFWRKVDEAPPAVDNAVLVKPEVVALADSTAVSGSSCTDPSAKVALSGATLAEGTEVPSEQGTSNTQLVAAVTGDEIGAQQAVLDNLEVQALSAEITSAGIVLRGNVRVTLSGVTSTIGFVGTLADLNNWSVNLSSTALTIPGITVAPVVFNGTLRSSYGVASLTLSAQAPSVKIGDISVTNASINFSASENTGVSAQVAGTVKVGPSTATGTVNVEFDKAGALVSAEADIAVRLLGTQAGGSKIDLTGTVKIVGDKDETSINFSGSGILGNLKVNEANVSLTLGANKATFVGLVDVEQGANYVRFNGSIVWDGITAYVPFLTLEGAGEYSGTLNDGTTVGVKGNLTTEVVGSQVYAVVNGNFQIGSLKASGRAVVESNGASTTLSISANLTGAGFAGTVDGVVVITDGQAETIQLDGTVTGSLSLGDATLTGASFSIRSSYGSPLDINFSGGLKIGTKANVNASVAASIGPNGTLLTLNCAFDGTLDLGGWTLNFTGGVVASTTQVALTGAGRVQMNSFPLGVVFNGTLVSSLTQPTWSLTGKGKLQLFSISVASARLNLSQQAGMEATRAGFYFSIIGIPTYFEGNFFLKPEGGCSKVDITGGSFLAKPILALVLPSVIGCPVNI